MLHYQTVMKKVNTYQMLNEIKCHSLQKERSILEILKQMN